MQAHRANAAGMRDGARRQAPRRRAWAAARVASSANATQQEQARTSDYASALSLEQRKQRLVLRIFQPKQSIVWERWELRMLELLEAQEAAQAAEQGDDETQTEAEESPQGQDAEGGAWEAQAWSSCFSLYDSPEVHLPWMRDAAYVRAWEEAVQHWAPTHIKGKVVLDLGCGPGLLALMCAKVASMPCTSRFPRGAQAGAKRVIAVDGSKAMAEVAEQVALANGYSKVIQVVHGRAEDLRLPERADVLVSNWPGPALLAGGMLRSVLHARRYLLKPNALVLPSSAELFVTGIEDKARLVQTKAQFESVAGFDLTPAMARVVLTPRVGTVERPSQLCTSTARLARVDWSGPLPPRASSPAALSVPASPFEVECQRDERLFGLLLHFDLAWDSGGGGGSEGGGGVQGTTAPAPFTTSPRAPATHWQQVALTFPRSVRVLKGDVLRGSVALEPATEGGGGAYGRDVRIKLTLEFKGVNAEAVYVLAHGVPTGAHSAMLAEAGTL